LTVYYNEIDPDLCRWLENLIAAGLIPQGRVDDRSITDVKPADLDGYDQCHFFAGVAGWPLALRLAGWPADRPVWTGSCPCQPFSAAGKGRAEHDPRHLWPVFVGLIAERRPQVVFGEQVSSRLGRRWLAGVYADLEAVGYRVPHDEQGNYEFYDLPAAGIGAPHIRQRLFWVADAGCAASERGTRRIPESQAAVRRQGEPHGHLPDGPSDGGETRGMGDAGRDGGRGDEPERDTQGRTAAGRTSQVGNPCGLGLANGTGQSPAGQTTAIRPACGDRPEADDALPSGPWGDFRIIPCADGKCRRISAQPGDEPLADGIPAKLADLLPRLGELAGDPDRAKAMAREARRARRVMLKAWGNAINPYVAAVFIRAASPQTPVD